jgi:hypothetical protein
VGHELQDSIKGEEFLEGLRDHELLKNDSTL